MTSRLLARLSLVAAVLLAGIAVDQGIKIAAFRLLEGRAPITAGIVQLRAIENRGAVLGLFAGLTATQRHWILSVAEVALLGGLVAYGVLASGTRRLELWAVSLVAAGGIGNVIDRLSLGFVRDYLLVGIDGWPTAAFNVADVLVVVGAVLLLAGALRSRPKAAAAAAAIAAWGVIATSGSPAHAEPAPAPRPVATRMVKLVGRPGDAETLQHVDFCKSIGFNALWVYSTEAGHWAPGEGSGKPRLDPAFVDLARRATADGIAMWVSINPVADTHEKFVFSDDAGLRRIVAFAKQLRVKAGVTHLVISFDDQPTQLAEFSDIVKFGASAAPAHIDLVRRLAAALPPDTSLWLCASAYCDAHLGDGTGRYAKPFLAGLHELPPTVGIVWTGPRVISPSITRADIEATRARLGGRPIFLYDNFPVNGDDDADALALILSPLRDREAGLRDVIAGYLSCPMPALGGSRFTLSTVADWLLDPDAYDPKAAVARALDRFSGGDREARKALDTQQIEWGGWIDERNWWPRDALNAGAAGKRLSDPAFVESFTWTADRYPSRMAALERLADRPFRDDLLRVMRRRLAVARAMPLVVEFLARRSAGRADAREVLAQIETQRRAVQDDRETARALNKFLLAADIPIS